MPQFFIKSSQFIGNRCIIEGDDYHHLVRARRVGIDDEIYLRIEDGTLFCGKIIEIKNSSLIVEVIDRMGKRNSILNLTMYIGLLKGKKFSFVIQKLVEIGVKRIFPLVTERTIPVIVDERKRKHDRWNRIALEAAKQSMRDDVPIVENITNYRDIVSNVTSGLRIIAHPSDNCMAFNNFLLDADKEYDVSLLIGPEGGFSRSEVDYAKGYGWENLNFGFTTLKAETAAIVLPAILFFEWNRRD